ncbi:hypothetical protein CUJ83_00835 [Methanocella sp. CWC-04]|uniref:Uncharacterized protein n=2 Tax=Methanooceanicella nereidis TaxID=2052831 RepID=A0AAP2RAX5_9EURY|nr:hypothetical protein [Methanocella sp. CWC-04]
MEAGPDMTVACAGGPGHTSAIQTCDGGYLLTGVSSGGSSRYAYLIVIDRDGKEVSMTSCDNVPYAPNAAMIDPDDAGQKVKNGNMMLFVVGCLVTLAGSLCACYMMFRIEKK